MEKDQVDDLEGKGMLNRVWLVHGFWRVCQCPGQENCTYAYGEYMPTGMAERMIINVQERWRQV